MVRCIVCLFTALCMLWGLTLAAGAAEDEPLDHSNSNYLCGTVDDLFFSLEEKQFVYYDEIEIPKSEHNKFVLSPQTIVPRYCDHKMTRSIKVSTDQVVEERLSILIPEGKTLTVEKGATLTVRGQICVEGELVNNGTIVLDGQREIAAELYTTSTSYQSDGWSYRKSINQNAVDSDSIKLTAFARITNTGLITNSGSMKITAGFVENDRGGTLQNDGLLTIDNGKHKLHGIYNTTRRSGSGQQVALVRNSGTMTLGGPEGFGIEGNKGSLTENAGTLSVSGGAVAGKVTGNAVRAQAGQEK